MKNTYDKYSFDLTYIYKDISEVEPDIQLIKKLTKEIVTLKNNLTNSKSNLLLFLNKQELLERMISKVYCYCSLNVDVNPNDQIFQTLMSTITNVMDSTNNELSFIKNELCNNEETILLYLKDIDLQEYKYQLERILRYKPHILDEDKEFLISKFNSISELSYSVYDSLRLDFPDVYINGIANTLNSATLYEFLKNPNQTVRKNAYYNYYGQYKRYENVFSKTLAGIMNKDEIYADIRNFNSGLEASLFDDEVPVELFDKVINHANVTYRPSFHKYMKLKKDILKLEPFNIYDINIPLVKSVRYNFSVEEGYEILLKALSPLGDDYLDIIKKSIDERWVDFYPKPGKKSGAYSGGCYDTKPYILMNYIGDYNSLSTLAHELGHSAQTFLSNKHQSPTNATYRLFVAEVASTVNEVLLIRYMIENAKSNDQKAYFLYEHLEKCVGLIYRQPMFGQFEHELHKLAKDKKAMSSKVITDLYQKISKEYYGPHVTLDSLTGYSNYDIPHFYYNYYVYKYTIGMTIALAIVKRILDNKDDTLNKYKLFLSSGGSMSPIDLLSIAGVNPLDDHIYHDAYDYFDKTLDEFIGIIK